MRVSFVMLDLRDISPWLAHHIIKLSCLGRVLGIRLAYSLGSCVIYHPLCLDIMISASPCLSDSNLLP